MYRYTCVHMYVHNFKGCPCTMWRRTPFGGFFLVVHQQLRWWSCHCVAVRCSMLQCVAVRSSALQCGAVSICDICHFQGGFFLVVHQQLQRWSCQCVAVCCSVLQRDAVCCSFSNGVVAACSMLQCGTVWRSV